MKRGHTTFNEAAVLHGGIQSSPRDRPRSVSTFNEAAVLPGGIPGRLDETVVIARPCFN